MKARNIIAAAALLLATAATAQPSAGKGRSDKQAPIVCNPIDLNYHFQPLDDDPARREAADPVCIWFNDAYYLFASKSGGYWRSTDLAHWHYIPCRTIAILNDYAPTVMAYKGELYFTSSCDDRQMRLFKTANPERDSWQEVECRFEYHHHDPAFFVDDDERVYFYWGCSDTDPIMGVEIDPANAFRAKGEPRALIHHCWPKNGWEVPGEWNDQQQAGWNEGPAVIKHNGLYYLQYAAPGTQFRTYGDGYYVGASPLGPFNYAPESPFSLKPGGFAGGAGHGDTFRDRYGNLWHVATMKVSVRHWFERRLGLWPVSITGGEGLFAHQDHGDYPFAIPQKAVDENHQWNLPRHNLLSRNRAVTASSELAGHPAAMAADEQVETWWSAATGSSGEWLQMDLGQVMTVRAVQVNLADQGFALRTPADATQPSDPAPVQYKYTIEASRDGRKWHTIVDERQNRRDAPHAFHPLGKPAKARYLRITNAADLPAPGCFSLYDLRVFGQGRGSAPAAVTGLSAQRSQDRRRYTFSWDAQPQATGYILHWGTHPSRLTHASTVFDNHYEAGYFNADAEYYFHVTAFNENGESR